jgi:hypothetical protein
MFIIAALFTIVRLWKQSKHSTTDEWIRKYAYTYTQNEILFSHKEG